jgi:hypothetical protein
MKNYIKFLVIFLAVAIIVPQIAFASWWNPFSWDWNSIILKIFSKPQVQQVEQVEQQQNQEENQNMIVGGDKDEHGCIGSAGYAWCEAKQKCLREWEEKCHIAPVLDAESHIETKNKIIKNCGISDLLSKDKPLDELNFQEDPVMVCLGQNIINCSPAKAIIKGKKDETLIEISGTDFSDCKIKDVVIKDSLDSSNINKYIECPINKVASLVSEEIIFDLTKDPGNTFFTILFPLSFYFMDPQKAINELGCTTNYK